MAQTRREFIEQLAERSGVPSYEGKLRDIFTLLETMQRAVLLRR